MLQTADLNTQNTESGQGYKAMTPLSFCIALHFWHLVNMIQSAETAGNPALPKPHITTAKGTSQVKTARKHFEL